MAGPLKRANPLLIARAQDAAGWLTIAVGLLLAPWNAFYDVLGLPSPRPAGAWQAAGAVLALAAVALWRSRSRGAIVGAGAADVAGATALAIWLATGPGLETRGTVVAAALLVALAIQAVADAVLLITPGSR